MTAGTASGHFFLTNTGGSSGLYGLYGGVTSDGDGWFQSARNDSATYYNLLLQANGGNVGIGTTSPSRKLSVEGSSSSIIADFKYSAAGYSSIDLSNNVSFARLSSVNSDLLLSPAGTERMRITSGGNVGIGTTTPNAKLDISGSANISGSGVQVPLQVSSGNTSLLFVSGSGNVGIGAVSTTYI
jgi:hypothetical protein